MNKSQPHPPTGKADRLDFTVSAAVSGQVRREFLSTLAKTHKVPESTIVEQLGESLELARVGRPLLVDEKGAVSRHTAYQQRLLQTQEIHFRDPRLAHDRADHAHLAIVDIELLLRRLNANNLGRALRQLLHDPVSRPTQQHRLQSLAQLLEILETEHATVLVDDAMRMKEPERGSQPAVIDELDNRVELVEAVLEWGTGQHEGER